MELTMSAFGKRLALESRGRRLPANCLFEITPTCNLRCQFCYVALDPYQGPYLSTEQVCRVLDIIERAGVLWLTLTGGEIFSRRDFETIYRYACQKGFLVRLYSNGTLVNERIAALLAELPPYEMEVSIYGADAEHYERTTQIPGSFARFERGVRRLLDAGVRLRLKTPVSKITQDHLPALVAYCRALGVPYGVDPFIDHHHDGGGQPSLYRISSKRASTILSEVQALSEGNYQRERYESYVAAHEELRRESDRGPLPACEETASESVNELYQCGAGRTGFFIDALGNCSHCVIDREPSFPILGMDWDELWARMGEWVTQPLPADAPCSGCSLRGSCANCPARSRLATGSPYLKDTYYCDVTHESFGLPPEKHPEYPSRKRPLGGCAA